MASAKQTVRSLENIEETNSRKARRRTSDVSRGRGRRRVSTPSTDHGPPSTVHRPQSIVALAGGVGGAKLADGLANCLPPEALTVIVNTGDDFEHWGLKICPDLD